MRERRVIDISVMSADDVGGSFYVKQVARFIKNGTSSWTNMLIFIHEVYT